MSPQWSLDSRVAVSTCWTFSRYHALTPRDTHKNPCKHQKKYLWSHLERQIYHLPCIFGLPRLDISGDNS